MQFARGQLRLSRSPEIPLGKDIALAAEDLCFITQSPMTRACFANVEVALQAGWGGARLTGESLFRPRLISVQRFLFLGGNVALDLTPTEPSALKPGVASQPGPGINSRLAKINGTVAALSRLILPKSQLSETRGEVPVMRVKTANSRSMSCARESSPWGGWQNFFEE